MSNDPLARSDFWAGALNENEYDAVYASVTATERGRWFLAEYASRNRHADTDRVVDAIARIEAAIHGDTAPSPADPAKDSTPDIAAVTERISDIAIGLRERGADETLCDALDAALREIAGMETAAESREEVRVPAEAPQRRADDEPLPEGAFFNMELQESKKFADAVAALAASLNASVDDLAPAGSSESAASEASAPPNDFASTAVPPAEPQARRWHIEGPDFVFHSPRETALPVAAALEVSPEPQPLLPQAGLQPDPDEDPAELFDLEPVAAEAVEAPAVEEPAMKEPLPPQVLSKQPMRPAPRPVADPLAAVRGLSQDDLTALFG